MKPEELSGFTNEQLLARQKKIKSDKIMNSVIVGLIIGIVSYSIVKNGFGFFTFFPLILMYFVFKNSKANNEIEKEIKNELDNRNL